MTDSASQQLQNTFAVLGPDMALNLESADAELYGRLAANYDNFSGHALIAVHGFSEDWDSWEMHPKGDELVTLISGGATMQLSTEEGIQSIDLREPGDYIVVPCGVWHTARVSSPTKMLFVTPGEDTQHSETPP